MMKFFSVALVTTVLALPLAASAGQVQNRIEQDRINQGVVSGQLTPHEFNVDEQRLKRIRAQRNNAIDNHTLTSAERAKLNREPNRKSNGVYFTKHNRADQPGA